MSLKKEDRVKQEDSSPPNKEYSPERGGLRKGFYD